jgi:hypothetical protein
VFYSMTLAAGVENGGVVGTLFVKNKKSIY